MEDELVTLEDRLLKMASKTSGDLMAAVRGKAALDITRARSGALSTVAMTLDALALLVKQRRRDRDASKVALRRIAELDVRSATELLERGDWKKLTAELQAIAEDALQRRRPVARTSALA